MADGQATIRSLGRPGDLGWVVMAHGEQYAAEFGWDTSFEALVARIVADYAGNHDPTREAAWVAEMDGRRVGCVFCVAAGNTTAQLRILLVDPSARGAGLGGRLVDECLRFAREVGYERLRLWTNDPLAPPGVSTCPVASGSSPRSRTAALAPIWSARCTSGVCAPTTLRRPPPALHFPRPKVS